MIGGVENVEKPKRTRWKLVAFYLFIQTLYFELNWDTL